MKTIQDYMKLSYKIEIIKDEQEDGFVISVPELKGCITCGETLQKAYEALEDAKFAWFEAALEDGYKIPMPNSDDDYSGQFKFRLPKSLHKHLAQNAKKEGISMNQYCLYLLTKYDTAYSVEKPQ